MNFLNLLNFLTALSADRELESVGPTIVLETPGGSTSDVLYKGSILAISTSGYAIVAADGAQASLTFPIGVCKKQVTVAGSGAEHVEIERGLFWFPKADAAQTNLGQFFYPTDDGTIASGTSGIAPLGACVGYKSGYLLIDMNIREW